MKPGARWEQLYTELRSEIERGLRQPGSKLPSLAELHRDRGTSQTTALRAYRTLIEDGLAVSAQGSGTYVADPLPDRDRSVDLEALAARVATLEAQVARLSDNPSHQVS